jgi:hypothetical protein
MVGAVAGSPGTAPTNWSVTNAGLTQTIVGTGVESGIQYIDLRFNGTASGDSLIVRFDTATGIAASNGQTWTNSFSFKKISESNPPTAYRLGMLEYTGAGVYIVIGTQNFTPTTTLQRFAFTRTLAGGAGVGAVQPVFQASLTVAATYDFTIRIAAPQMELGAYATTFIPTTTAAVTRLAEAASKTGISSLIGQTEGTLFLDFEGGANDSVEYVFGINNGSTTNRIIIYRTNGNLISASIRAGSTQALFQTLVVTPDTRHKCAIGYKSNDVVFYVNGVQIGSDGAATIPACSIISADAGTFGSSPFLRPVNQAALFPTRLTNAQLVDITGGRIYYNPVEAYYAYYLTPEIPSAVITSVNSFF